MFLRLLFGGQGLLEVDHDDGAAQNKKDDTQSKVLKCCSRPSVQLQLW